MSSPWCYTGQILAEIAFGLQNLSEVPHIRVHKVYESLSRGIRVATHTQADRQTDRRTDRPDEANSRFRNCFLKNRQRICLLAKLHSYTFTFEGNLNFIEPVWSLTAMCRVLTVSDIYL